MRWLRRDKRKPYFWSMLMEFDGELYSEHGVIMAGPGDSALSVFNTVRTILEKRRPGIGGDVVTFNIVPNKL